jgi:hypothetical protein
MGVCLVHFALQFLTEPEPEPWSRNDDVTVELVAYGLALFFVRPH